jgi:hypothetical protein
MKARQLPQLGQNEWRLPQTRPNQTALSGLVLHSF